MRPNYHHCDHGRDEPTTIKRDELDVSAASHSYTCYPAVPSDYREIGLIASAKDRDDERARRGVLGKDEA